MFKNKKLTIQEKMFLVAGAGAAAAAYVWHRKQVDALISTWQELRDDTMWSSFDSGVQYGIALAQRLAAGDVVSTEDVRQSFETAKAAGAVLGKAA